MVRVQQILTILLSLFAFFLGANNDKSLEELFSEIPDEVAASPKDATHYDQLIVLEHI